MSNAVMVMASYSFVCVEISGAAIFTSFRKLAWTSRDPTGFKATYEKDFFVLLRNIISKRFASSVLREIVKVWKTLLRYWSD